MRDTTKLHPVLQNKLKTLKLLCEQNGLKLGISECVRTKSEQDALYAKGRTAPGNIVTNVKYPNSMHCWGIAFDFYRNDGKGAYDNSDGFFDKVGKLGQSIDLEWGGAWKSIIDKPHLQLKSWGSTPSKLISQYGTPQKFFDSWNTTESKKAYSGTFATPILKKGSKGTQVIYLQKFLNWYGGYAVACDGQFGNATLKALKDFQTKEKLTVDGVWGSKSLAKAKTIKK